MWGNAWFIVKADLRRTKWGLVVSTLMYAYFSVFGSFIVNELFPNSPEPVSMHVSFLADIMFLCSMSCIGFFMTGEYRYYWRSDVFTKRLMYMRSLPIDTKELVLARYMQMGINLLYLSIIFFVPFYFICVLGEMLTVAEYISFAIVWMSFGACMSILFAYKEMCGSGKSYFWFCMLGVVAYFAASGAAWYAGFGFVKLSVELVDQFGLFVSLASLLITWIWTLAWSRITKQKISRRDYAR
ncbi:hypothetical protein FE783_36165 [Paenibacillus mesophilus]|uniref:hypothetical protein n=1 Tax=Paenibacillus mesophilus TaxID=2582849 RepID=UPI00110EC358|nr:hypothetical protein [Paenibacillus mesophilus]TMV43107.1 hypothetical protein FE783_36165 [Paenibacillus mesophilus]